MTLAPPATPSELIGKYAEKLLLGLIVKNHLSGRPVVWIAT